MKKWFLISLALVCLSSNPLKALEASLTHANFRSGNQSFVEMYFHILGSSVNYDSMADGRLQASVLVTVLISNESGVIVADKFSLNSPLLNKKQDFIDLKRYGLKKGTYTIKVEMIDRADSTNNLTIESPFQMDYQFSGLEQSEIQLLSSIKKEKGNTVFHKQGFFMEPLPFNLYHRFTNQLILYNEIYDSKNSLGEEFFVTYCIYEELVEGKQEIVTVHKRQKPQEVNPLLYQIDITDLPSGNYFLSVEVKTREQELKSKRTVEFSRSNPSADVQKYYASDPSIDRSWVDEMDPKKVVYSLKALMPVLSHHEIETLNYLLDDSETKYQKNFLYYYWSSQFSINPQAAYKEYMKVADAVDNMYNYGFGYGFESDRGLIFLKYGRPDHIIPMQNDNGAYPYEIWYYNRLETGQNDVRFLFYNPTLGDKAYVLLHSNARRERSNPNWERELYKGAYNANSDNNGIDGTGVKDNFLRRARELFEN